MLVNLKKLTMNAKSLRRLASDYEKSCSDCSQDSIINQIDLPSISEYHHHNSKPSESKSIYYTPNKAPTPNSNSLSMGKMLSRKFKHCEED